MTRYIFFLLFFAAFTLSAQGDLSWSGEINTANGDDFGNTTVSLLDVDGNTVASQAVDCDGIFSLEGLSADTDYTLAISREGNAYNGVTTFDMILISKHVLGVQSLSGPYALAAADANGNGSLSVLDVVLLRALILAINQDLPGGSWNFYPADSTTSINNTIINLTDSVSGVSIIGVKKGDVNSTFEPCE